MSENSLEHNPPNDEVFVLKNGLRLGPYSLDELLERVDRGEIDYEDLCLRDFASECQRVREVLDWEDENTEVPEIITDEDDFETVEDDTALIEEIPEPEEAPEPATSAAQKARGSQRPKDPSLILYSGHPSVVSFPKSLIILFLSLGMGLWFKESSGWILFMGLIFALIAISHIIFERSTVRYLITPRRVEIEKGFIAKSSNEVLIDDIRTINVVRTGLLGMIGVGRVEFASSGGQEVEVAFDQVWSAQRVKGLVRRLQDADHS